MQQSFLELNWESFDGSDTDSVIRFYNQHIRKLHSYLKNVIPDKILLTDSEAQDNGYNRLLKTSRNVGYWFHKSLPVNNNNRAKLLYKSAALGKFSEDQCKKYSIDYVGKEIGEFLSSLIYTVDKFDPYKYDHNDSKITALSEFIPYIEHTKRGTSLIRWMGSSDGKAKIRTENLIYEQVLLYGPGGIGKSLCCAGRGVSLSPYTRTNFLTGESVNVSDGQWHHVLYTRNGSVFKTNEPSKLLTERPYKLFSHNQHIEMLGCIPLCGDEHDAIHASNGIDGIDNWFKRFANGEAKFLPYHFVNEEQYNETILWISDNTLNFDLLNAPDYETFIRLLSTPILQNLQNISLQDFGSAPLTKNHPSVQRSIPYNEWLEKTRKKDHPEILPISLFV